MGLSGKYNFQGIKTKGAAGLKLALSSSPYTAWLAKIPALSDLLLEFVTNWLANKGLIVLNVGYFYVDGKIDQAALDRAIDSGIARVAAGGLTPEQMKEIDDAVINAANKALPYGKAPKPQRNT